MVLLSGSGTPAATGSTNIAGATRAFYITGMELRPRFISAAAPLQLLIQLLRLWDMQQTC